MSVRRFVSCAQSFSAVRVTALVFVKVNMAAHIVRDMSLRIRIDESLAVSYDEVEDAVLQHVRVDEVSCIARVQRHHYQVTLKNQIAKETLLTHGVDVKARHFACECVQKPKTQYTAVTLLMPFEMDDSHVTSILCRKGTLVSTRRLTSKKHPTIETGVRLFKFKDCTADDFPSLITIGHYNLVVRVCGKMVRHCYRCKSASHLVRDCPEPDTRSHDYQAEMDADTNASEPYPLRERADSPWTYDGRSCAGTPELPYLEVDHPILDGDGQRDSSLGAPSSSVTVDNSDLLLGSEEVVGEELTSQNDEEGRPPAQAPTLADDSTPDETSHCAPDPHVNDKVTNPSADSSHSVATTSLQTSGTADWAEATLSANRDHSYFDTGDKDNPVFVEPPPKRSKRRKQTQRYARSLSSSPGRSMRSRSRSKEPNVIFHEGEPMMPYRMRDGTTVMRKLRSDSPYFRKSSDAPESIATLPDTQ